MTMVIRFLIGGLYLVGSLKLTAASPQPYAPEISFFRKRLLFDYRASDLFFIERSKNSKK